MQQKPFFVTPKMSFLVGLAIPLLLGGLSKPLPVEYQTIANALVSSVIAGLSAALAFWLVSAKRSEALFPLFCFAIGNTLGATGLALLQNLDIVSVIVRLIASLILVGLAYQYVAKKVKKK